MDVRSALDAIVHRPLGTFLLGVVAARLSSYVCWRFVQAILDPEGVCIGPRGAIRRGGHVINGLIFAGIAYNAVEIMVGWDTPYHSTTEDWAAHLLMQPVGRWTIAIVGGIVVGIGLYHCYAAFTAVFRRKLTVGEMSARAEIWATHLGRFGFAARGIVFMVSGGLVIRAALRLDADQVGGISDALQQLGWHPFGPWVLGLVASGLLAQGIYLLVEAYYRRIGGR